MQVKYCFYVVLFEQRVCVCCVCAKLSGQITLNEANGRMNDKYKNKKGSRFLV
jgi:hypothetical protein